MSLAETQQRLQAAADDPKWADHAEVPKRLLAAAARALNQYREHYVSQTAYDAVRAELEATRARFDELVRLLATGHALAKPSLVVDNADLLRECRAALNSVHPAVLDTRALVAKIDERLSR